MEPEWEYEMTIGPVLEGELSPSESGLGRSAEFDEVVDGQRKHLRGAGWELASHDITRWNERLHLTLLWRRRAD